VLSGDLAEEVGKLKQQFDGDILVTGSARLVQSLVDDDLVDELRFMVFPVVLAAGKRLFKDDADKAAFRLVETKQAAGVAILTFRRTEA